MQPAVVSEGNGKTFGEIQKQVGARWRALTKEQQDEWKQKAARANEEQEPVADDEQTTAAASDDQDHSTNSGKATRKSRRQSQTLQSKQIDIAS